MNKRKLYDLTINALIFSRLYVNYERYGNLVGWGYPVRISKYRLTDELHVTFTGMELTIHKYDP